MKAIKICFSKCIEFLKKNLFNLSRSQTWIIWDLYIIYLIYRYQHLCFLQRYGQFYVDTASPQVLSHFRVVFGIRTQSWTVQLAHAHRITASTLAHWATEWPWIIWDLRLSDSQTNGKIQNLFSYLMKSMKVLVLKSWKTLWQNSILWFLQHLMIMWAVIDRQKRIYIYNTQNLSVCLCVWPPFFSAPRHNTNLRPVS